MPRAPFTVVQLTDLHLGATWSPDPVAALAAAIATVERVLPATPDAVIVTGDLASTPTDSEYEQAGARLGRLSAPVYVLPGNHDDRAMLRRHFDLPPTVADTVSYVADLGPIRLVALDSQHPGHDGGQIDRARLRWLDHALGEDPSTPTLLAMHHPPLVTGLPGMDAIGIAEPDRLALAEVVGRHRQVQLIAAGHVHRTLIGQLSGAVVVAVASTDAQLALDFVDDELRFVEEPPCFAVHVLVDGRLVTHVQPV